MSAHDVAGHMADHQAARVDAALLHILARETFPILIRHTPDGPEPENGLSVVRTASDPMRVQIQWYGRALWTGAWSLRDGSRYEWGEAWSLPSREEAARIVGAV